MAGDAHRIILRAHGGILARQHTGDTTINATFTAARTLAVAFAIVLLAGEAAIDTEILDKVLKETTRRIRPSEFGPNRNFGDSFYIAQNAVRWVMVAVGDPLYSPRIFTHQR